MQMKYEDFLICWNPILVYNLDLVTNTIYCNGNLFYLSKNQLQAQQVNISYILYNHYYFIV